MSEPYISHNALVSPQSVVVEAMATYTWMCKKGLLLSKVICVQNTAESKKRSGFLAQNVMIYSLPQYTLYMYHIRLVLIPKAKATVTWGLKAQRGPRDVQSNPNQFNAATYFFDSVKVLLVK